MHLVTVVFQEIWHSDKENLGASWNATLSCPSMASSSDLAPDADHSLDFLTYLVLQACISFCSVSDKSGALLFLPCSHKSAVAHVFSVVFYITILPFFALCSSLRRKVRETQKNEGRPVDPHP